MALFGRKKQDQAAAAADAEKRLLPELTEVVNRVIVPCASLRPGGRPPASATASYVAGHPYLPDGAAWPTYADRPMFFLCQVNFDDVPDLPDFPESGLLQWFVGADGPWGLTFDETAGRVGFAVRWYADPSGSSVQPPSAPTPWHELRRVHAPVDFTEATELVITAGHTLPAYPELRPDPERDRLVAAWAEVRGEEPEDLEFVWDEYVRGVSGPFPELVTGSNLGGTASFTQYDPRGSGNYPAADRPEGRLLIEIDSAEFGGWADAGIAHLFGDPAAVASGDQSSLRYHWDCC